jgi:oligopeptide/dipeptide ABC transporter ATP-binding protein
MDPLLSVRSLRVEATSSVGTIVAVDKFDLDIYPGDVIGLIGESGSGKTTAVRSMLGLTERNVRITDGSIFFGGEQVLGDGINDLPRLRGRHVGMVFQNASSSLNPLLRINTQMQQVLRANRPDQGGAARRERIEQVISRMGFGDPKRVLRSYPHQLSGGMRQRAAIAIAIVSEPELVIADESTSALDVTTQAEVMDLVRELATDMGHSLIYVTHDLLLAAEVCTRMAVMYGGEIVELGPTSTVVGAPSHPYTLGLLRSVPMWAKKAPLVGIDGTPPRVTPGFEGCRFASRCSHAVAACSDADVAWTQPGPEHGYRCIQPEGAPLHATRG